jgi:hypothetical protein
VTYHRTVAYSRGRIVAVLSLLAIGACGARSSLETDGAENESEPPPPCGIDDRVLGDGEWMRPIPTRPTEYSGGHLTSGPEVQLDGRLVLAGVVEGDVRLDCETTTALGERDLLLYSFGPDGASARARRIGAPGVAFDRVVMAIDGSDRSYLLALSEGEGTFDVGAGPMKPGVLVASFEPNGTLRWARSYPQDLVVGAIGIALAVSRQGEVTLATQFQGPLTLGDTTLDGGFDDQTRAALARWEQNGELREFAYYGDSIALYSVAYAENGDLAIISSGMIEMRHAGDPLWASPFEGSDIERTPTFVGGELITSPDRWVPEPGVWLRSRDAFTGSTLWEQSLLAWSGEGGEWPPHASSIVPTPTGLVVAAPLLGSVDFGLGIHQSAGIFDSLLLSLSGSGQPLAVRQIGSIGGESIESMVGLPDGHVALVLDTDEPFDLGFGKTPPQCELPCEHRLLTVVRPP